MDDRDRRFYSRLALVFGLLFVPGGLLFAFTTPGATYVWLGLAMLLGGIGLRTRLPVIVVAIAALVVFAALVGYTAFAYP